MPLGMVSLKPNDRVTARSLYDTKKGDARMKIRHSGISIFGDNHE